MYKVLIVDDEIFVRMGLKNSIEWEKNGFLLIGEASNGVQALEIIKANTPDIVITDIKMPEMDGVQLIRNLKKSYPSIRCLVLSNYDDFELVKEALKNGAEDYFLKVTIQTEALLQALKDICVKFEEERNSKDNTMKIVETLNDHKAVIKSKFIEDMTDLKIPIDAVLNRIHTLGLKLHYDMGCLIYFSIVNSEHIIRTRFEGDRNLFIFSVINISEEIVNYHSSGEVFEYRGDFIAVITAQKAVENSTIKFIAGHLKTATKDYLDMEAAFVYGYEFGSIQALRGSLQKLDEIKSLLFYENEGLIIHRDSVFFSKEDSINLLNEAKRELETYIKMNDTEGIVKSFEKVYDFIQTNRLLPVQAKGTVIQIINFVTDRLIRQNMYTEDMRISNILMDVTNSATFNGLKNICQSFVSNCIELIQGSEPNHYRAEIKKVIEYIYKHYDMKITLEDMAKHISMNKSYFSRLFRQETGEQFQLFLMRVRMEKAGECILNSDRKISDIASDIGYSDIFYFNKVFKSHFKMSPGEYRNTNKVQS